MKIKNKEINSKKTEKDRKKKNRNRMKMARTLRKKLKS